MYSYVVGIPADKPKVVAKPDWVAKNRDDFLEEAKKIVCNCIPQPQKHEISVQHKSCPVADFTPWKSVHAEWVPHLSKIVFYAYVGHEKTLVDDDGTIINKVNCFCDPQPEYYCSKCKVRRATKQSEWKSAEISSTSYSSGYSKDRHYGAKVTFPDGTTVWASSAHSRKKGEVRPDFGLYLANSWNPECLAYMLPWQDYGLPTIQWEIARWAIEQAFESAKTINVEVGCVGGHGRTGTVLACMATMAGVSVKNAVKWVRKNYCEHAVESEDQEWWVKWFDCTRKGIAVPKRPVKKVTKTTTTTNKLCKEKTCKKYGTDYNQGYCYDHRPVKSSKEKVCKQPDCHTLFYVSDSEYCYTHRVIYEKHETKTQAKAETTLPTCPGCNIQMYLNQTDKEMVCFTMDCTVDYAVESEEFGWVYYNESNEEIASDKGDLILAPSAKELKEIVDPNLPPDLQEELEWLDAVAYFKNLGLKTCDFCKEDMGLFYNLTSCSGFRSCMNPECSDSFLPEDIDEFVVITAQEFQLYESENK